jgi:alanine dehydrogenase
VGPERRLTFGFPRMEAEAGERRDFLPELVAVLVRKHGAEIVLEEGLGARMGIGESDYLRDAPTARFAEREEAFAQDVVVVLRCPSESEFALLKGGATLVSMLHFPTRPERVERLRELELEAVGLDLLTDDEDRRLVENLRAVAWNGVEAAFDAIEGLWPALTSPSRDPVRVTVLGAGSVGRHAVEAATKYGRQQRADELLRGGVPGVEVTAIGRNLTGDREYLRRRLALTDILVDATQRSDPSVALVPNAWVGLLPPHAVICDCVVDPYLLRGRPKVVRGIEGIPQGNLDRWILPPDDPAWERTVPPEIPSEHRRTVASCYSWPGVHPKACMRRYGTQLAPVLETLVERGGMDGIRPDGSYHERALARAGLRWWTGAIQHDGPGHGE